MSRKPIDLPNHIFFPITPLEYALRLKRYRFRAGLTQSKLAFYLQVSKSTIAGLERGAFYPSLTLALKIEYFYMVVDDYFYEREED